MFSTPVFRDFLTHTKEKAGILDSGIAHLRLVAGACNHPNCLVLPVRFPMIRVAA
jgi:hypothetical protein